MHSVFMHVYSIEISPEGKNLNVVKGIYNGNTLQTHIAINKKEFFYSNGIEECNFGEFKRGKFYKRLFLGKTHYTISEIRQYLDEIRNKWRPDDHDVLSHSSNHFASEFSMFLIKNGIPSVLVSGLNEELKEMNHLILESIQNEVLEYDCGKTRSTDKNGDILKSGNSVGFKLELNGSHTYLSLGATDVDAILELQKAEIQRIISTIDPTSIILDSIKIFENKTDIFGYSSKTITRLLLPALFLEFNESNLNFRIDSEALGQKNRYVDKPTTDIDGVIDYIITVSGIWCSSQLSTWINDANSLMNENEKSSSQNKKVQYVPTASDHVASILDTFITKSVEGIPLPLIIDLCTMCLIANQCNIVNSEGAPAEKKSPKFRAVSVSITNLVNRLSKYTAKDLKNSEAIHSLLRLLRAYYTILSINSAISVKQKREFTGLSEEIIIDIPSRTIEWIIFAFGSSDSAIVADAANILNAIVAVDIIGIKLIKHEDRSVAVGLLAKITKMFKEYIDNEDKEEFSTNNYKLKKGVNMILNRIYQISQSSY